MSYLMLVMVDGAVFGPIVKSEKPKDTEIRSDFSSDEDDFWHWHPSDSAKKQKP